MIATVPAITFAATANAVLMTGADVIFATAKTTGILDVNHLKILLRDESQRKRSKLSQSFTWLGKHVT